MRCNEEHHHSITSSARASSVEGASTPSDLAVFYIDRELKFDRLFDG